MELLYLILIAIAVVVILTKYKQEHAAITYCTSIERTTLPQKCTTRIEGKSCCIPTPQKNKSYKGVCKLQSCIIPSDDPNNPYN